MNESSRLPSLSALRTFLVVVQTGSFTEAARRLFMTQSAISKQIRILEEYYGVPLLFRTNRELILTDAGNTLLPHVYEVIDRLKIAERLLKNQAAVLTLQVYVTFAVRWLMPRLTRFYQKNPHAQLRIETMVNDIDDQEITNQVRILHGRGQWPGMKAELLVAEELSPVCAPSFLKGKNRLRNIHDLSGQTLYHTSPDRDEWKRWLTANQVPSLEPYQHQLVDLHHMAWTAAANGLGIAMGNIQLLKEDLDAGLLVCPFKPGLKTDFGYYLVYPEYYADNTLLLSLRDWLISEVQLGKQ